MLKKTVASCHPSSLVVSSSACRPSFEATSYAIGSFSFIASIVGPAFVDSKSFGEGFPFEEVTSSLGAEQEQLLK